jgi:hypothetical protein
VNTVIPVVVNPLTDSNRASMGAVFMAKMKGMEPKEERTSQETEQMTMPWAVEGDLRSLVRNRKEPVNRERTAVRAKANGVPSSWEIRE